MTAPDTDTLAGLLAEATPGPWQMSGSRGAVQNLYGHDVGPDGKPVAVVDYPPPGRHASDDIHRRCRANAHLIALVPELATEVITLRAQAAKDKARIERLEAALSFYGDPSGWNQPPVKVLEGLFTTEYENQASKIRSDRGKVARSALAAYEARRQK